jgi:hypothetical protein
MREVMLRSCRSTELGSIQSALEYQLFLVKLMCSRAQTHVVPQDFSTGRPLECASPCSQREQVDEYEAISYRSL